ncbi:MAG: GHKL domain-containing protein [Lachnospiraceae bacterium]|nr:GHKL domain-containing protein [Lachnospiraceae bacterium]
MLVTKLFIKDFLSEKWEKPYASLSLDNLWVIGIFSINVLINNRILNFSAAVLFTFILTISFYGPYWKKALVSILCTLLAASCEFLSEIILSPIKVDGILFVAHLLTIILLLIIERMVGIILRRNRGIDILGKEVILLYILPFLSFAILYCITYGDIEYKYLLVASASSAGICIIALLLYNGISKQIQEKVENAILEKQVESFKNELDTIQKTERKIQNLRHDMRHHLLEIEGLAARNKTNEIQTYIGELRKSIADGYKTVNTGAYEIDSLLNYLLDDAQKKLINVETDIIIPEDLEVSGYKYSVIIGNLLENAIEASFKSIQKYLRIEMRVEKGILRLKIINSYNRSIKPSSGIGYKRSGHGIGLRSVKDLVVEQKGEYVIKTDDDFYTAEVILYIA